MTYGPHNIRQSAAAALGQAERLRALVQGESLVIRTLVDTLVTELRDLRTELDHAGSGSRDRS